MLGRGLLVEAFLAGSDVVETREQLIEVVRASVRGLQVFVVDDEVLLQVLLECRIRPVTKLRAARGADAGANSQDCFQATEGCLVLLVICSA